MSSSTTNADQIAYDAAPDLSEEMKKEPYSLMIRVGWTFSGGEPSGEYALKIPNHDNIGEKFSNGVIVIKNRLKVLKGTGELEITPTNGPTYRAKVNLGPLPDTQTPAGLAQRLTNLGFYAGTDGTFSGRMAWAVRAFKRIKMNDYTRNKVEVENNAATKGFLIAVQNAFGVHPGDEVKGELSLTFSNATVPYCGMFGNHVYKRGNFENAKLQNDVDNGPKVTGIWEGVSAAKYENEPIAGEYELHLRAFDPEKEGAFSNRVNLPQPIHMAQFVLFELGYWFVAGETTNTDKRKDKKGHWVNWAPLNWVQLDNTWTRDSFKPDGGFGPSTQWAVREFQCHAKFGHAAKENVASTEKRYLLRVFSATPVANPPKLTGVARYPDDKPISGALNKETREALQAWVDSNLRCPVIVYASTDESIDGSNLDKVAQENLWFYKDHAFSKSRMFAIDYSGYYKIPNVYGGEVNSGGYKFPRPIVLGRYTYALQGGLISGPPNSTWKSQDVEITPNNLIGRGGINGTGLTSEELSTFKVIRTASYFECGGYFDCFNAYDNVTISFGPCHWTLAGTSIDKASEPRELPAFLAYVKHAYPNTYQTFIGKFGLSPLKKWTDNDWNRPQINETGVIKGKGSYNDNITIQIEETEKNKKGYQILCGASHDARENTYCKGWQWFYRFQMTCRIAEYFRRAMWDFTRFRIRDILETVLVYTIIENDKITKKEMIKIGDYITSEKGVAMLLRWHIWRPNHITCSPIIDKYKDGKYIGKDDNNYICRIISEQIKAYGSEEELNKQQKQLGKDAILQQKQLREDAILKEIAAVSLTILDKNGKPQNRGINDLYNLKDVPQSSGPGDRVYRLNLGLNKKLSSEYGSFKLQRPEPPPKEE